MPLDPDDAPRSTLTRIAIPLGILASCAVAYWLSTTFERVPPILKRGMQPSDFPQLVILLIAALAVWLLFTDKSKAPQKLSLPVQVTIGLLIAFLLLSQIDLFLGLGVFAVLLAFFWGERRIPALALVAIVAPLAVFFLFDGIFDVRFPRGLLTNFWYE